MISKCALFGRPGILSSLPSLSWLTGLARRLLPSKVVSTVVLKLFGYVDGLCFAVRRLTPPCQLGNCSGTSSPLRSSLSSLSTCHALCHRRLIPRGLGREKVRRPPGTSPHRPGSGVRFLVDLFFIEPCLLPAGCWSNTPPPAKLPNRFYRISAPAWSRTQNLKLGKPPYSLPALGRPSCSQGRQERAVATCQKCCTHDLAQVAASLGLSRGAGGSSGSRKDILEGLERGPQLHFSA